MHETHPHSDAVPQKHLSLSPRGHVILSVLWFSLNFQSAALLPIIIPTQLLLFVSPGAVGNAQQATFLGWLSAAGALLAMLVPPLVGALSDRTAGPLGRRRPYIAAGTLLLLLGAWVLAGAPNLTLLVSGFVVFQLGSTVGTTGYQSLLPDRVREEQRGEASGYLGLMTILGNIGSLALAALLLQDVSLGGTGEGVIAHGAAVYYLVTGAILLAGALITLFGVEEVPLAALPESRTRAAESSRLAALGSWIGPWRSANFAWVFLTRCFVMFGLTLFLTFIEYYFANVAHMADFVQETAVLALLALFSAVLSAFTVGVLSDRLGRIGLVFVSTLCMAAAALAFVVFSSGLPLWPLGLVFGVGYGGYTSVDWALAVDVLPSSATVGRDMGIWGIASSLPAVLAPLAGSFVIAGAEEYGNIALGYRLVFALAAVFLLLGAGFVLRVRTGVASTGAGERHVPAPRAVSRGWRLAARAGAGRARGFLRVWPIWEWLTQRFLPISAIPGAPHGLFGMRRARYHGKPVTLPDGTRVARGDPIVELHFRNDRLPKIVARSSTWRLARMLAEDLQALARWSSRLDRDDAPRAVFGVTVLGRAAPRLGFFVRPRPRGVYTWLEGLFMTGLLALYHPEGTGRLRRGTTYGSAPAEVWMSREELIRRYGRSAR
jgi:MFS family permease